MDSKASPDWTLAAEQLAQAVMPLQCATQQYAWGKLGRSSTVARLAEAALCDESSSTAGESAPAAFQVAEDQPYAELWIGTHPSGPSRCLPHHAQRSVVTSPASRQKQCGLPLSEFLLQHPQMAPGADPATGQLPFLFKVLSVAKSLSIQAHPDKQLARTLHAQAPEHYRDDNHKPEMTVALTPFEALCGFRPSGEIARYLKRVPELRALVGEPAAAAFEQAAHSASASSASAAPNSDSNSKAALRDLFAALMRQPEARVKQQVDSMAQRVRDEIHADDLDDAERLSLRLHAQFPGDVGVMCAFVLNYLVLAPGDALFLCANEPHAYLDGDCVEVMAASDNVVRAGLTPKFKDVDTLIHMLTYTQGAPFHVVPRTLDQRRDTVIDGHAHSVAAYCPPIDEFKLDRVSLKAGGHVTLAPCRGAALLLCVAGRGALHWMPEPEPSPSDDGPSVSSAQQAAAAVAGQRSCPLHFGSVHFVAAHTTITLRADGEDVLLFRATTSQRHLWVDRSGADYGAAAAAPSH